MSDHVKELIDKCNRLKEYDTHGLVLIAEADIVEILHEIYPYTMKKLEQLEANH